MRRTKKTKLKINLDLPPENKLPEFPIVEPKIAQNLSEEAREIAKKARIKHALAEIAELGHKVFNALPESYKKELTLRLIQSNSRGKASDVRKCIKIFTTALLNAAKEHCYYTRRKYYEENGKDVQE